MKEWLVVYRNDCEAGSCLEYEGFETEKEAKVFIQELIGYGTSQSEILLIHNGNVSFV